jgi:hypothetical protein
LGVILHWHLEQETKLLLDVALNLGTIYGPDQLTETVEILLGKTRADLTTSWEELVKKGMISQFVFQWALKEPDETKKIISEFLAETGVTADKITDLLETKIREKPNKLNLLIKALGQINELERDKYITFSDGGWNSELGNLCDELVRDRIFFRYSSSSRKHSYRTFYVRTWPFDCEDIIKKIVFKHLNVEGLTDKEWQVLTLFLLARDLELDYPSVQRNTTLTDAELRETITKLKERGLIEEQYEKVNLMQRLKEPLFQYFGLTFYPKWKSTMISAMKQRIGESVSVLWLLLTGKCIYDSPKGEIRSEPVPCKSITRSDITEFEPRLSDLRKLGIILDFGNTIVVRADIIRELENWLRGSIKESLVFIAAGDYYLARRVLQDIFSKCSDYIKIQDPYIGEETFDIIEYIPRDLKIQLLTGLTLGEGEEPMRIRGRIERLRSERRGKFNVLFIGHRQSREAPFHDRFILTKNKGWQVGTSIKQVGGGKDTTISILSRNEKDEYIEPAFDRWWNLKENELEQKNLVKLDFEKWKEFLTADASG